MPTAITEVVTGYHDFEWLCTQADDPETKRAIDKIVAIEECFLAGRPVQVSTELMNLRLSGNIIWTREFTTHSIPFGYVQIFKLLDQILPSSFRQAMDGLIVDIGANEGHWLLYMHKHHPGASFIAVEPNPIALELFSRNLKSNNVKNAEVLPVALSDRVECRQFETINNVTSIGSFNIDRAGRPWLTPERVKNITVQCETLDSILRNKKDTPIDLIKIDVEGAELEVINGASTTLRQAKRIEIEYGSNENKAILVRTLEEQGFTLLLDHIYNKGRGDLFFLRNN